MRRLLILMVIAFVIAFVAGCNSNQNPKAVNIPAPIRADSLTAKFMSTKIRKDKLGRGIYNYIDTTFKSTLIVVRDTINEISVNNQGKGYLILGRPKNGKDIQCVFSNGKELDSLNLKQVITLSSDHIQGKAASKIIGQDTINIFVVQMLKCKLLNK